MLWIVFILCYVFTAAHPTMDISMEEFEDDAWYRGSDKLKQQFLQDYANSQQDLNVPEIEVYDFVPRKRALALLSRWQPFSTRLSSLMRGGSAVRRPPMLSMLPSLSHVPQTRGQVRPLGQPLRWGRR